MVSIVLLGGVGVLLLVVGGLGWRVISGDNVDGMRSHLQSKWSGHDLVAEVEWTDGRVTYLGADYREEDPTGIRLENGLPMKIVGQGGDPVDIGGVPVVRCRSDLACPIDGGLAVAMDLEDDGRFEAVDAHGNTVEDGASAEAIQEQATATDGGVQEDVVGPATPMTASRSGGGVADHRYDPDPPGEYQGWVHSLANAVQYAPHAISPEDLKLAEERGKQSERGAHEMKVLMMGIGIGVGVIVFFIFIVWLMGQIGGGGGVPIPVGVLDAPSVLTGSVIPGVWGGDGG